MGKHLVHISLASNRESHSPGSRVDRDEEEVEGLVLVRRQVVFLG